MSKLGTDLLTALSLYVGLTLIMWVLIGVAGLTFAKGEVIYLSFAFASAPLLPALFTVLIRPYISKEVSRSDE